MIGRTNTGGGGVGGVLTVTAPAGVTVEVSKDGKVKRKTANAEGLAIFKGLKTGTWTLTITDGVQTSTKPVVITADYSTTIAFFAATINITYPSGSTCTCTDGTTTLTAPNTSGTWKCIVPNAGTWKVSCTDGSKETNKNVSITSDGQSKSVDLSYEIIIIENGVLVKSLTVTSGGDEPKVEQKNGYVSIKGTTYGHGAAYTKVNVSDKTTVTIKGTLALDANDPWQYLAVWSKVENGDGVSKNILASKKPTTTGASVDVSTLSGEVYVGITTVAMLEHKVTDFRVK